MSDLYRHPLAAVRAALGVSATGYLRLLADRHAALGYGRMATRREKVARWEAGTTTPEPSAQAAMADLHGIDTATVARAGWPHWLLAVVAETTDRTVLESAWTPVGTVKALAACVQGESMDRRAFLITSGTALTGLSASWNAALHHAVTPSSQGRSHLSVDVLTQLERRLGDLRHLDDTLGGAALRQAAQAEYRLITHLTNQTRYDTATGQRLYALISEAARICAWQHFDAGLHAAAQKFFVTSLRASADASDPLAGAHTLSFLAIQTYNAGDPRDATALMTTALETTRTRATPRVRAMLHARLARAHSKVDGSEQACMRHLEWARTEFAHGTSDQDPEWIYWFTAGELEMLAGSCARDLADPAGAIDCFTAARAADYANVTTADAAAFSARDVALFSAREADAYLDLGEVEQACHIARTAWEHSAAVDSTRPSDALAAFRARLIDYRHVPAARELIDAAR